MKNLWMIALCVTAGVAGYGGAATAPVGPKPGSLESYKDWTIGCDNRNRCETVALLAEGASWPDHPLLVGVARDAGPNAEAELWIDHDERYGRAAISILIDGRKIASANSEGSTAQFRGPQAAALAIAMARGRGMEVRAGNRVIGRPSLAGSAAALRYMDGLQGRAGTTTALVATGPLGPTAVRPAPATPTIKRVSIPAGPVPTALWREELTAIGTLTGCTDEMRDGPLPELHRLSRSETLVIVPCGAGAYNFSSVPLIATGVPGRRQFRHALFDFQPGGGERAAKPMLVNASFAPNRSRLASYAKGRGLGDCGGSEAYVWDGTRFRLIEARAMDECRGSWHWITTWSAQAVD
jgi:hypothetical protein